MWLPCVSRAVAADSAARAWPVFSPELRNCQGGERNTLMRLLLLLALSLWPGPVFAAWDLSRADIDTGEILSGGPSKDGIPALLAPRFAAAAEAAFMRPDDLVLGVDINGIAKAYPTRILSWHELVNDRFGGLPVLVSW
ncbi:hypothetical protein B5V00_02715 [Geothermobacter hydrogeniphilus]|uniref:DUF3179 domain-containing protein n=1 Tax=Geothermobacter hydrogeniphilus TaxID=1969733 RepID=A0A1X0YCN7_9BACT|nr:hypothetical protein B5V00_02715 [Geothermobacter hydrogeniphilus]